MPVPIEVIFGASGLGLLGTVSYFLKKTHEKIDDTARAVDRVADQLRKDHKETRDEIIETFQSICRERQGACSNLQAAKLQAVESTSKHACEKVLRMSEDRERKWEKQEIFNDRITRILYQTKDGGRSWQLKDKGED
jgi:predicted negative regulator of RcsB-dependent stress response